MKRVIARLDVKPPHVVKPICFEGLRKMGDPADLTARYYDGGADEILFVDIVASLYQREPQVELVRETARQVFVPFAYGGGVRSVAEATDLFHAGVDKVLVNTFALQNDPSIINELSSTYGRQAVMVHIEAKRWDGWFECYTDCGRVRTGKNVRDWVREVQERGAGEILVSSVDNDGLQSGFDLELMRLVRDEAKVPVIAGSGAGSIEHVLELFREVSVDAVALGSVFHYGVCGPKEVKRALNEAGFEVSL